MVKSGAGFKNDDVGVYKGGRGSNFAAGNVDGGSVEAEGAVVNIHKRLGAVCGFYHRGGINAESAGADDGRKYDCPDPLPKCGDQPCKVYFKNIFGVVVFH